MLVNKDDLSTIHDHAMARVTEKSKDSLLGVALEETIQLIGHLLTIFHPSFYQGHVLIRSKTKACDDLLEIALVSEYTR